MEGLVWSALFLLLCSFCDINVSAAKHKKLIVLLIDGFRWDYFDDPNLKVKLKGFPNVMKRGVKAQYMNPVFPSLSYPNINSFSTGLYPENHGFVDNLLWDKKSDTFFEMMLARNSSDPRWWQAAEPIWITAEKNGLRTALYWWSGCEVKIHGYQPQICERYRYEPPSEEGKRDVLERVDDIIEMFKPSVRLNYERLDLAMIYYSSVDWAGHWRGMDSPEFRNSVRYMDEVLDYMLKAIDKARLTNEVNIMVFSDHGMADVRNSTFISLEKYSADIKYHVNAGPISSLVPMDGKEDKLYKAIKADNITGLHVFLKKDIPDSYHTKNAKRVGPIVLECDEAYFVKALADPTKRVGDTTFFNYFGEHGYAPNASSDMRAIFLATGPDFRTGLTTKPVEIIDLYNIMCHILKIDPLPNNGTWDNVVPMLRTIADGPYYIRSNSISTYCFSCIIILISAFIAIFPFNYASVI